VDYRGGLRIKMSKEKLKLYSNYFLKNKIYFLIILGTLLSLINVFQSGIDIENKIWILYFLISTEIIILIFIFTLWLIKYLATRVFIKYIKT